MSLKVAVLACVAVVALCDKAPVHIPHPPVYTSRPYHAPAPYHAPEPAYHAPEPAYHAPEPAYHAPKHYEPEYPDVPPKYNYNYGVADGYSGVNLGHSEARDGYKTEGSYTVDLPDGRKQTVKYVDNGDGLVAEVSYEGEAQYPEHPPAYKPAPPAYAPPPATYA
ncbi:cuticle protein 8-like [Penaeus vannamei]|uniref:cuticle protein 8-like n=1 Tax=Penaeus vannamei TaxID=6689 RepID=UPI00387F43DF